jgi:hypothetical protein
MEMTRELRREGWQAYFDELVTSQALQATLELVGPELGDQTEAERMPLDSISYDDQDDAITIGLGGWGHRYPVVLWHTIDRPRRVELYEHDGSPQAILIEGGDGVRTLVRLSPDHEKAGVR